jgi:ribosomal protein S18 acetylase RimI-like enzyme
VNQSRVAAVYVHSQHRSQGIGKSFEQENPMTITINPEQPDTPNAIELIAELDAVLNPNYPPESRHGYSVEKLIKQGVAFFVVYVDGGPAGCGGVQLFGLENAELIGAAYAELKHLGAAYAELKRMFVRPQFRGLGLGKRLVTHLCDYAAERGIKLLRLETGVAQTEALGLYEGMGFKRIPPFGDYRPDPLSICMEKQLD